MTRPKCGWIASRTLAWHPTPWSATPHSVICTRKDLLTNIRVMRSALLTIVGICRIQSHDSDIYTWHGFVQTIAGCVSGRDIGLGLVRALQHHFGVINANVVWPKQNAFHARIQRCNCSRAFFVDIAPARATPSIDLHTQYNNTICCLPACHLDTSWYNDTSITIYHAILERTVFPQGWTLSQRLLPNLVRSIVGRAVLHIPITAWCAIWGLKLPWCLRNDWACNVVFTKLSKSLKKKKTQQFNGKTKS